MDQKSLSRWLKLVIAGVAVCLLLVAFWIVPALGRGANCHPAVQAHLGAWLAVVWIAVLPCAAVLWLAWRIAANIGADRSFSQENARLLRLIAILAAADGAYFFLANAVLALLGWSEGWLFAASLFLDFLAAAVTVAGAALSHLVKKAAALQEQSDLTI